MAGVYKINRTTLEQIADAAREKLEVDYAIKGKNLATEVGRIQIGKPMSTTEVDYEDSGYYGMEAARTAESYLKARQIDGVAWNYNAVSIFDNYDADAKEREANNFEDADSQDTEDDDETDYDASITDQSAYAGYDPAATVATASNPVYRLYGYATKPYLKYKKKYIAPIIDCSTFIGLALRGIDYDHSPWKLYGAPEIGDYTWTPRVDLPNLVRLCNKPWAQTQLDYQPAGAFTDIGISGHSSVRLAAELGEFYYAAGKVLYDRVINSLAQRRTNVPTEEEIWPMLRPGDLLFFAGRKVVNSDYDEYETESEVNAEGQTVYYTMSIHERWRSISHVAMVATNPTKLIEVTNGRYSLPNAVYMRDIALHNKKLNGLTLVIRPDYRPRKAPEKTTIGENQCVYPWYFSQKKEYVSDGGATLKTTGSNTIVLNGTTTAAKTLGVKGTQNTEESALWLSKGTYQLGIGNAAYTSGQLNLQVNKKDNTEFSPAIRAYGGHTTTFELTEDTEVLVRLYIGAGLTFSNTMLNLSLVRTA